MDMQVSVGSPPGHGHSDIGHAGVSGQPPLDADIWILDMQVSVGIFLNGCVQICLEVMVFASISSPSVILTPNLKNESS